MADLKDVTFNVGISISNETVHRCCQLLEIYLQDNPDKTIRVEDRKMEWSGERVVSVFVGEKETPIEDNKVYQGQCKGDTTWGSSTRALKR